MALRDRTDAGERHGDEIRSLATPLATEADLAPLLDVVGDARIVLLGEGNRIVDAHAEEVPGPRRRGL